MALEDMTGTNKFINALDSVNPDGPTDQKHEGDDHIRGIKNVLFNCFEFIVGKVTASHQDLNLVTGLSAAGTKTLLDILYPVGAIYMSTVNASPDVLMGGTWNAIRTGRVLISEDGSYAPGATGGSKNAVVGSHTHTAGSFSALSNGAHTHSFSTLNTLAGAGNPLASSGSVAGAGVTDSDGAHTHSVSGTSSNASGAASVTNANMPPYLAVYMWERTL